MAKNYLVIGLGNFGSTVVRELSRLGCKVTAVDHNREKVQQVKDELSVVSIFGRADSQEFLERLKVSDFDGVVVSTGEDSHASILITMYLKELAARSIVVKANSRDHAKILTKVGATQTVIPEQQMAIKVAHSLAHPNLIDLLPLTSEFVVAELTPTESLIGKKLKDSQIRARFRVQVVAVRKAGRENLVFVPDGEYQISSDDILIVLGLESDIVRMKE
jgi:trk system potassium uptake protein TrkA